MATAAVAGPQSVARPQPKAPKEPRPAPTVPVHYPLTGFLYARRADYKRSAPPSDEIHMQVRAASANESVFGFDHECVYIRPRDASHVLTVRLHQKKEIGRWVTALYYQSFSGKSPTAAAAAAAAAEADRTVAAGVAGKRDSERPPEPGSATKSKPSEQQQQQMQVTVREKRKSVSFQEEPEVRVLPRESFDPADLFYSEREYAQFQLHNALEAEAAMAAAGRRAEGEGATDKKKKNLSRLMRAFYAKTAAKLRVSHKKRLEQELR